MTDDSFEAQICVEDAESMMMWGKKNSILVDKDIISLLSLLKTLCIYGTPLDLL